MLLTLTLTRPPATDLGYLLHKHPERCSRSRCRSGRRTSSIRRRPTSAARRRCCSTSTRSGSSAAACGSRALDQYVNDRPYVASSFLSVAIARVFGTALAGKCEGAARAGGRARSRCDARLAVLPCAAARGCCGGSFEPLGYAVDAIDHPLDETFPEWGESRYFTVELDGERPAARAARAPVRAGAGARRRQALLGRRRRGREAAAPRRGLARRRIRSAS